MVDRRLGYTRIANRDTWLGCEIIFLLIPLYPWKSPPHWLGQECTYPGRQVAGVTKFCTVTPNTCVPSVRNLLLVIILAPRMLRCLLDFWKICGPPPPGLGGSTASEPVRRRCQKFPASLRVSSRGHQARSPSCCDWFAQRVIVKIIFYSWTIVSSLSRCKF